MSRSEKEIFSENHKKTLSARQKFKKTKKMSKRPPKNAVLSDFLTILYAEFFTSKILPFSQKRQDLLSLVYFLLFFLIFKLFDKFLDTLESFLNVRKRIAV